MSDWTRWYPVVYRHGTTEVGLNRRSFAHMFSEFGYITRFFQKQLKIALQIPMPSYSGLWHNYF